MFFFFQAEDGIRDKLVTGVQTCALPISSGVSGVVWPAHETVALSLLRQKSRAHWRSHARSIPGTDTVRQPPEVLVAALRSHLLGLPPARLLHKSLLDLAKSLPVYLRDEIRISLWAPLLELRAIRDSCALSSAQHYWRCGSARLKIAPFPQSSSGGRRH